MENKTLETKKFKKVRTIEQLELDPRVESLYKDEDGWWLQLADGYEWAPNSTLIHEDTISACCGLLNWAVKEVKTNEQPTQMESDLKELGIDLAKKFEREDNKYSWTWDFKVNGFTFWMDAVKDLDGMWEFITYYDGDELTKYWDTRKWAGWEIRVDMVQRFFDEQLAKDC